MPNDGFADGVARAVLDGYASLGRNGKPQPHEWAVLSGIVCENTDTAEFRVLSIATGNKCLGANKQSGRGEVLSDSHAEVLARRSFIRLLHLELHRALQKSQSGEPDSESILQLASNDEHGHQYKLRDHLRLHMYVSEPPCGDSAIFQTESDGSASNFTGAKPARVMKAWLCKRNDSNTFCQSRQQQHEADADHQQQGQEQEQEQEQELGILRTKSGRSDLPWDHRTLSMSCSDKIVRWAVLGLQGALLSTRLAQPLYLHSLVVSCPDAPPASASAAKVGDDGTQAVKAASLVALRRAVARVELIRCHWNSAEFTSTSTPSLGQSGCMAGVLEQQQCPVQSCKFTPCPLQVFVTSTKFANGKHRIADAAGSGGRGRQRKASAAGTALNWCLVRHSQQDVGRAPSIPSTTTPTPSTATSIPQSQHVRKPDLRGTVFAGGDKVEVTVGAVGLKQGAAARRGKRKRRRSGDVKRTAMEEKKASETEVAASDQQTNPCRVKDAQSSCEGMHQVALQKVEALTEAARHREQLQTETESTIEPGQAEEKQPQQYQRSVSSRLCRASFFRSFLQLCDYHASQAQSSSSVTPTYWQAKLRAEDYQEARRRFLQQPVVRDWVVAPPKLQEFREDPASCAHVGCGCGV